MGYVNATTVYARDTGRTFTATSRPATSQVGEFIEQTAAELDGILRQRGYTIPVATTATSALKLLEHYNALGAAAMIEQAAPTHGGKRDDAFKLWEECKKALMSGKVELDAGKDSTQTKPRFRRSGSGWGFGASPMVPDEFER